MRIVVPPTATSVPEWIRRTATAINGLIGDTAALQAFAGKPSGASFTFTPVTLPGSPDLGMTVLDATDHVVKTWDGSAWRAHY